MCDNLNWMLALHRPLIASTHIPAVVCRMHGVSQYQAQNHSCDRRFTAQLRPACFITVCATQLDCPAAISPVGTRGTAFKQPHFGYLKTKTSKNFLVPGTITIRGLDIAAGALESLDDNMQKPIIHGRCLKKHLPCLAHPDHKPMETSNG